jgi:peptidoglycan hydrolase-like protein with peptidoglycan-binding domain
LEDGHQDSSHADSVSAESLRSAIEDFQSFAGLKITGKVIAPVSTFIHPPSGLFNNKSLT